MENKNNGCLLAIIFIFAGIAVLTIIDAIANLLRSISKDIDLYHKREGGTITGKTLNHFLPGRQALPPDKTTTYTDAVDEPLDLDDIPLKQAEKAKREYDDFYDG